MVGGQYSDEIGPGDKYSITNGHASVNIDSGDLSFHRVGVNGSTSMVLQESLTNGPSRSYQQSSDESWFEATFSFETTDHASERVFGAGGDQDGNLNRKNTSLELVKKNTYNPIPTYMSDRGYLMFWNLPSYGKMDFSSSRLVSRPDYMYHHSSPFLTMQEAPNFTVIRHILLTTTSLSDPLVTTTGCLSDTQQLPADLP